MKAHERMTDAIRDIVSLYVLGSLPADEAVKFEAHLPACKSCQAEIRSLRPVAERLLRGAPIAEPPARLKQRLLQRIQDRPQVDPGLTLVRNQEHQWEQSGLPGIEVRRLFVDPFSRRQTVLVRMESGASYPLHGHGGVEECFVVEGDLLDGDMKMLAGDYSRYEEGTSHGPLSTGGGCLLLVTSSLHDEIIHQPNA